MGGEAHEKKLRVAPFAIHATRGIVRDRGMRRRVMLVLLAVALVMLVAGSTFLRDALAPHEHAGRYIFFWLACAWLTLSSLLLAIFDALVVRAEGRAARRVLREHVAGGGRAPMDDRESE